MIDPTLCSMDPVYCAGDPTLATPDPGAATGSPAAGTPPSDPGACHTFCDSTYAADASAWSECVSQCGVIAPQPCDPLSGKLGECFPNWLPLPNSAATAPVPFGLKIGAAGLIGAAILAVFVFGIGQGVGGKV